MNKTRNQIYYQNNQEKLKAKRKKRYQLNKFRKEKIIQKERKRIEKQLKKWKLKLHLFKEACLYFPEFSTYWKLGKVQEKVQKIEMSLNELSKKAPK